VGEIERSEEIKSGRKRRKGGGEKMMGE